MNEQKWKALKPIHRNGITGKTWCERGDIFYGNELLAFLEKEKAIEKVTTKTVYRWKHTKELVPVRYISGNCYDHLLSIGEIIESEEIVEPERFQVLEDITESEAGNE